MRRCCFFFLLLAKLLSPFSSVQTLRCLFDTVFIVWLSSFSRGRCLWSCCCRDARVRWDKRQRSDCQRTLWPLSWSFKSFSHWKSFFFLLLGVEEVVKLVMSYVGVGGHNHGSIRVQIPAGCTQRNKSLTCGSTLSFSAIWGNLLLCLLLQLHAPDALQVSTGRAHGVLIEGLDFVCDFGQCPLLLLLRGLPRHTEAFSTWERHNRPQWTSQSQMENIQDLFQTGNHSLRARSATSTATSSSFIMSLGSVRTDNRNIQGSTLFIH